MKKVKTIIKKEWAQVFKNRLVLFSVIFLPLIIIAIPLGTFYAIGRDPDFENIGSQDLPAEFSNLCPEGMNGLECFQVYMVSQFMILFMILPVAIPASISSYSVVGEKKERSLEPLLATPISTLELLAGKSIAALLPAVLATYLAYGLFIIGTRFLIPGDLFYRAVLDTHWILAVIVVGPLLALMAVSFSVMVSSRVNEPRVAEQISMIIIIPLIAILFAQIAGLFVINKELVLASALILLVLDTLLMGLAVQVFQRESILTRWK